MILALACLICGILAFLFSTSQYYHAAVSEKKFDNFGAAANYFTVLKRTKAFILCGFLYCLIDVLALIIMYYGGDKIYHPASTVELLIMGVGFGAGANAVNNLSLYTFKNGDKTYSVGIKLLVDYVNDNVATNIPTQFSRSLTNFIHAVLSKPPFAQMSIQQLIDHMSGFTPFGQRAQKVAFQKDAAPLQNKDDVMQLFIQQFGLGHFEDAIKP